MGERRPAGSLRRAFDLDSGLFGEAPVAHVRVSKDLLMHGDETRAKAELERASALIPKDDEARAEADSLLRRLAVR